MASAPGLRDLGIVQVPPGVTTAAGSLAAGQYLLPVRGVNAAGEGPASHDVRIRVGTLPTCAVPEAPVLLPATVVDRLVQLTWRESRNTAVANYRVLVGSQPGAADLYTFDAGPVNALGTVAPPGQYFVSIVATNGCGTSAPSNVIAVDVEAGLPAPASLGGAVDGSRVTLAWDAVPGADGYVLEAGTGAGLIDIGLVPTSIAGLVLDGVPPGTYFVRVRAVRTGVTSHPSGEIVVAVP